MGPVEQKVLLKDYEVRREEDIKGGPMYKVFN